MRARAQSDPADKSATLKAMAKVLDASLGRAADAQSVLIRALAETPEDASLYAEIDRLAGVSGGYGGYADALSYAGGASLGPALTHEGWRRRGKIAEVGLKDDRRAIAAYAKTIEEAGADP